MYFIFHQCWYLDTADNAANYYSTKNDLWLNYNPLTFQVFELTDARLSSLHTAGTVYKNLECCSLERKKIKSLKWGNTIILCYLSPCEEHLVCMCVRGAWVCVCLPLWGQSRYTPEPCRVSATRSSLLSDRIKPLREQTWLFLIGHRLYRFCSGENLFGPSLTHLSPWCEWYLGGGLKSVKRALSQCTLVRSLSFEQTSLQGADVRVVKIKASEAADSQVALKCSL